MLADMQSEDPIILDWCMRAFLKTAQGRFVQPQEKRYRCLLQAISNVREYEKERLYQSQGGVGERQVSA
jgi:hypothetical protein